MVSRCRSYARSRTGWFRRMLPHMLSVSRDGDLFGGMWAVVAAVFVYRHSYGRGCCRCLIPHGRNRTELCPLFYLSALFPVPLLGNGHADWNRGCRDVFTRSTGRRNHHRNHDCGRDGVGAISPDQAWKEPILRMVDTIARVAVRVLGAWISLQPSHAGSTAA
jgi:hypothetical protein